MRLSPDDFCKEFFREYWDGCGDTTDIASLYGLPCKLTMELIQHGKFLHDLEAAANKRETEASNSVPWTPTDISSPIELRSNQIELQSLDGEYHHFYIVVTEDRIAFGGVTNTGFIESGYLQRDDCFSLDEQLQSLVEDLEVFYNDGREYTSEIVCNDRM